MRLIDADAFQKFIEKQDESADYERCSFEEWLEQQPTIEAKPVVHAHWENEHLNRYGHLCHCCSNCGFSASHKDKNWCANCGAQMDEGVKIPVISLEDVPKIAKEMEK